MAAIRAQPERSIDPIDLDPFAPLPRLLGGRGEPPRRSLVDRVVGLYGPVIVHAPWLWGAVFRLTNNPLALRAFATTLAEVPLRRLRVAIERTEAAALVSVHPPDGGSAAPVRPASAAAHDHRHRPGGRPSLVGGARR